MNIFNKFFVQYQYEWFYSNIKDDYFQKREKENEIYIKILFN